MNRKLIAVLMVLCLLLSACGAALAETWTCPSCGTQNENNFCSECGEPKPSSDWVCPDCGASNSGKFCSNCGAKKPGGGSPNTNTISNVRCQDLYNGKTTITWDDSANAGPYNVYFAAAEWTDYLATYGSDSYNNKSCTIWHLVPGVTYTVTVTNGTSYASTTYTPSKDTFTDFKTGKQLKMDKTTFSIADDYYTTFRMTVKYPRLGSPKRYVYLLALKTPLGYCSKVYTSEAYELEKKYSGYYGEYSVSEWLDCVKANFGSIPVGSYEFEVYFDGGFYASAEFYVRN